MGRAEALPTRDQRQRRLAVAMVTVMMPMVVGLSIGGRDGTDEYEEGGGSEEKTV